MAAKIASNFQLSTQIDLNKFSKKPSGIHQFPQRFNKKERLQIHVSAFMKQKRCVKRNSLIMCSSQNYQASALEIGNLPASAFDEVLLLKNKSDEIEPYLSDRCIYLVGMMGSGKTTIGRIMAEVLGYSFRDCDKLIEQASGGIIVADIFKLYGETFFRDNETEVLKEMSARQRLVISTGGGAVVRPINWKYMHKGISVWLDVPLEALARRITACGTDSRPLLHNGDGDAYTRTLKHLNTLWEDRSEAYTNADTRVSLEHIAAKLGYKDVCTITPTEIAFEALLQIECFVKK